MQVIVPQPAREIIGDSAQAFLRAPDCSKKYQNLIKPGTFVAVETAFALAGDIANRINDVGAMPISPVEIDQIDNGCVIRDCFIREGSSGDVIVVSFSAEGNPVTLVIMQGIRYFDRHCFLVETQKYKEVIKTFEAFLPLKGTLSEGSDGVYKLPIKKVADSEDVHVTDVEWFKGLIKNHWRLGVIFPSNDGWYVFSKITPQSVLKYKDPCIDCRRVTHSGRLVFYSVPKANPQLAFFVHFEKLKYYCRVCL